MTKTAMIRARVDERHIKRIEELARSTGFSVSQILRALIDSAELRLPPTVLTCEPEPTCRQSTNAN